MALDTTAKQSYHVIETCLFNNLIHSFCSECCRYSIAFRSTKRVARMRLICIEDGDHLSLVEYFKVIPRYAILSHTWGPDHEEVTLRDFLDGMDAAVENPEPMRSRRFWVTLSRLFLFTVPGYRVR